jgi:hypothetical protein
MAGSFWSKLSKPINSELKALKKKRDEVAKEISHLETVLSNFFGSKKTTTKTARKGRKGKRIRRSPEQLQKLAGEVMAYIKGSEDGVVAGDIKKKFGTNFLPSPKAFLHKYGFNVKTKGKGKRPVYYV